MGRIDNKVIKTEDSLIIDRIATTNKMVMKTKDKITIGNKEIRAI